MPCPFGDSTGFSLTCSRNQVDTLTDDNPVRLLEAERRRLLEKFYRSHRSSMRVPAGAACWVVGKNEIQAGLCLTAVEEGYWLTGLLVAPEHRHRGLAQRLVRRVIQNHASPIWLFCSPELSSFYSQLDFVEAERLPPSLNSRLQAYRRSKPLIALCHRSIRGTPLQYQGEMGSLAGKVSSSASSN